MNIVRIPRLLIQTILLLSFAGSTLLLTGCGGGDSKKSTASSSSSSSSHSFSSTPITPPNSGTWPNVKVSANGNKALNFEWTAVADTSYYKLLKKADANATYEQVGSTFTTTSISDPISVHLTDWVNSRYKVQACNNSACQDSTEIVIDSAMLSSVTYVKASNTDAGDWFGWSVAVSGDGNTMAVGAPVESSNAKGVNGDQTNNTSIGSGAVYVFVKSNGIWSQQAYLKASNTEQADNPDTFLANDRFGYQIALSADGNTLAVSAINEDSFSIGINCDQSDSIYYSSSSSSSVAHHYNADFGAVYVFQRSGTDWSQKAYLKSIDNTQATAFGFTLALSGDGKTLAVGAASDAGAFNGILDLSKITVACINLSASSASLASSSSSSSSSTASTSSIGGANSGGVYVYRETDTGWAYNAFVKASDADAGDNFGASIALDTDGNTMAVGATGEDSKDTGSTNDTIVLGSVTYALNAGAVYVYNYTNQAWSEQAKVKPANNVLNQEFGSSVALSGDGSTLAVGTPGDWSKASGINGNAADYDLGGIPSTYASGATYIFTRAGTSWSQQAYIKPIHPQPATRFGDVVSLSDDGSLLAVGCWLESSVASGINGDQFDTSATSSGAAFLFKRAGNDWSQKSYIKAPNPDSQDRFGHALGLDASGDTLVVGAHRESSKATGVNGDKTDNSATAAGAVYIF